MFRALISWSRRGFLALVFLMAPACASTSDFVDAKKFDYSLKLDIRYATKNNFTKEQMYPEARCLLRKNVVQALGKVQSAMKLKELSLKLYECYRPLSVQKKFWELVPDEKYVASPAKGSKHNRGAAVDLTLVNKSGEELDMGTGYDDFSEKAWRSYQGLSKKQAANRKMLEGAMVKEGFIPLPEEWWHFDYKDWEKYPIADVPFGAVK